jgi:hypothetical protein
LKPSWPYILVLVALFFWACVGGGRAPEPGSALGAAPAHRIQAGPPVVTGTVIAASSLAPLAGATVVGPSGQQTVTDARGRFSLRGLAAGASGDLTASSGDLQGSVRLRPLAGGRLEVVLYLQ